MKNGSNFVTSLKIPSIQYKDPEVTAVPRRVFSNAHVYHINSLSVNSDGETYESLAKPKKRITPFITKITNITNEMVEDKPDEKTVISEFVDFIKANLLKIQKYGIFLWKTGGIKTYHQVGREKT